jgi:tyrosine-protein kinase Etk/Wzc
MTGARKTLKGNSKIATDSQSGIITVSVIDRDPERAAKIANAYITYLRGLTQTFAVTEASQRRLFYEEQLKRTKEDFVAAEYSFQQVQYKKGIIQPDAQGRALIAGLAELRARVAEKQVELGMLRTYSTERNPNVELIEKELSSLKEEVHKLESGQSDTSELGMKDVPGASLDYLRAEHELMYQRTLLDLLIKQYDAAKLDEAKDATVIQVVEPAIPPERRSSPERSLIVIFAIFMGFAAACAYVLGVECIRGDPELSQRLVGLRLALHARAILDR